MSDKNLRNGSLESKCNYDRTLISIDGYKGSPRDMNGYAEDSGDEQDQFTDLIPKRQKNILDDLTNHRAERVQVLIKNLANEDLVHIDEQKVPAFLRIDQDVNRKRELLGEFHQQYMNYDIDEMAKKTKRDLQNRLIEAGAEFKTHVS